MPACDHGRVLDKPETIELEEARPVDPYGDVPLGVECAWPQSIPAAQLAGPPDFAS